MSLVTRVHVLSMVGLHIFPQLSCIIFIMKKFSYGLSGAVNPLQPFHHYSRLVRDLSSLDSGLMMSDHVIALCRAPILSA